MTGRPLVLALLLLLGGRRFEAERRFQDLDADLAGRDRCAVEVGEMAGIVLAQCRQAQDRGVAVHCRIEQQLAQMPAQFDGRRISRHRLAEVDQRPIGGARRRRARDLRQECAASQYVLLPALLAPFVRIDFTQFSSTNALSRFAGGRSIRVSWEAVKPRLKRRLIRKCIA